MRKIILGAALVSLTGCGSGGTDFSVNVKGDTSSVKQALASIHYQSASATGVAAVAMTSDDEGLTFKIPSAPGYDPGVIRLEFVPSGPVTKVDVAIDIPAVTMPGGKYVAEDKVEAEFKKNLASWARNYASKGAAASTDDLEITLTSVAVAVQRVNPDGVYFASGSDSDWGNSGAGWADDSSYDDYEPAYDEYEVASDDGWGDSASSGSDGWGDGG